MAANRTATLRRIARRSRKVARAAGRRLLAEAVLDSRDTTPLAVASPVSRTYRLVIFTEVWENYGYRHKPKGGCEYHIPLGTIHDVRALGPKGLEALVAQARPHVEHRSTEQLHSYDEWLRGWDVFGDQDRTPDEKMDDDFVAWGHRNADKERTHNAERRADWWALVQGGQAG